MTENTQSIYEAALQLPEGERLTLVSRLMDTLPPDTQGLSMDDPNLVEELERRWAENGPGVSWSELRDRS